MTQKRILVTGGAGAGVITEDMPQRPINPYGATKPMVESSKTMRTPTA